MQAMTSGNSAAISLFDIVILATIFLSVVFFRTYPLSFRTSANSARSSATLPYETKPNKVPSQHGDPLNYVIVVMSQIGFRKWVKGNLTSKEGRRELWQSTWNPRS